jgi:hypothetical protein
MAATASNASATDQARHHQFKFHLSPECAAELEPIAKHYGEDIFIQMVSLHGTVQAFETNAINNSTQF